MTVIALLEDHQLAISDALLTVDDPRVSTLTPTTGNTATFTGLKVGVSRLVRKCITAHGPVGRAELLVSGTVSHIEHFASILNTAFRSPHLIPEELRAFIKIDGAYGCVHAAAMLANANGYNEFEIVGVAGSRMCSHTFDATKIVATIPYFGTVWIAGSGATNLLTWLELRGKRYEAHYSHLSSAERRFHIANNIPLFLMEEDFSSSHRTLKSGVGGYYEAYEVSSGELTPIDDCLTVFADLLGRPRDEKLLVRRLMYHRYSNGILYIFSLKHDIALSGSVPATVPLSECNLFKLSGLRPEPSRPDWVINRLASQMLGARIMRTVLKKSEVLPTETKRFVSDLPRYPQLLKLSVTGDNLTIRINPEAFHHFYSRFIEDRTTPILV